MKIIDINELKQSAVHTGLLETVILLNEVRCKANAVSKEDWTLHSECAEKLQEISESVCAYEGDIARIIGMIIADRVEEYIDNTPQAITLKSSK